ncbi:zf-HC2 domain-containing protein [Paenibacillus sp. MMS20-IR301]|uniref:zf-HC2 domain-containing protein n=1 Tax=Paenibacillus sp. MMS20-IR301 TaxID=2895946 RepID=UPI0028EE68A1|nr:zf-HC2 domain-containing protein [Paenibacillus sp. MMS20-IR301]WNS40914.1 zf-HC2 domain-containing protein [Paenibacillus sp. MMS20-IR301]
MNCATVKEWMPHYIDGQLSPEADYSIRQHIQSCPGCAEWLEEARGLAALWSDMEAELGTASPEAMSPDFPDLTADVMAQIDRLENGRRERVMKSTMSRRRTAPGTSWMHYGVAVGLTFLLLQFGVFEHLAYGITEINGQMSSSVSTWFNPQSNNP